MLRRSMSLAACALTALSGLLIISPNAEAVSTPQGSLVSATPATGTPNIQDGAVNSIVQVGNKIIVGGTFTSVKNAGTAGTAGAAITRNRLLAFDATTGKLDTDFNPNANGAVNVVLPAGDGTSVYIGGSFTSVKGVARSRLARINVSDGSVVTTFAPGTVGSTVNDLRLSNGHLWVAGAFPKIGGVTQPALASVDPTTAKPQTAYMSLAVAGIHNSGTTTVSKIDITPDGNTLVAIGNFSSVAGQTRNQVFQLDLSGATAALSGWNTTFYSPACASWAFDTYMRDLDISPDGSFVVISTTGAYGGSESPCDSQSRWELGPNTSGQTPSWVDYTGGDTTYAVEVTNSAVYVGGHMRWENNAFAGDNAGPGAVSREGIAALNPINGLPYSWNPTRTRGVGVFDFLYTSQGLWVGSDTDLIGGGTRMKIALMPLAGGTTIPAVSTPTLPNDVYVAGQTGQATDPSVLYRVDAGGPALAASTGIDWSANTNESPSPYVTGNNNRAGWGSLVGSVNSSVPAGTPRDLFSNELWNSGGSEMHWGFPVTTGTSLQVNLYFANRCSCTSAAGQRVFNVDIDGVRKLTNFDIVADAGDNTGTMKSFAITSDGTVDIDLSHVVENPLINGIEIKQVGGASSTAPAVVRRKLTAGGTVGATATAPAGSIDWSTVKGAFMLNGQVYTAFGDGSFTRRTFNGTTYGSPVAVDTASRLSRLTDWEADIASMTGLFYDSGRVYFTKSGSSQLFFRYFNPESDVVGAKRFVASESVSGLDLSAVRGLFLSGNTLYWAAGDGSLHSTGWNGSTFNGAPVANSSAVVSGPAVDGKSWSAHALFLFQGSDGGAGGAAPTAAFSSVCSGPVCTFDASASVGSGRSIDSYSWDFGDGQTGSGSSVTNTYASSGTRTVTLTVTDAAGDTGTVSHQVSPTATAPVVSYVGAATTSGNRSTHSAVVPAGVQAGDTLLMFLTANSSTVTATTPAGWTLLSGQTTSGFQALAYTKQATATDAGSTASVVTSAAAKSTLTVAAYHGGTVAGVTASNGSIETATATSHTTPTAAVSKANSWLVSYWGDKSTGGQTWTVPATQTVRSTGALTGSGATSGVLSDSNGSVPVGTAGGVTATSGVSTKAAKFTVVIADNG